MLSKLAISGPVPSRFWRTLMRALSHLSPSSKSSPPRPSRMSLPSPPRTMLAAVELIVSRAQNAVRAGEGRAQERPQAGDTVGTGERAAQDASDGDLGRGCLVAADEIVVERPGQALHILVAGEDLRIDRLRKVLLAHLRVLDDADVGLDDGVLEGGPVEAGVPFEPLAGGAGGEEDVVAALAGHDDVTEAPGDKDVIAVPLVAAQGVLGVAEHVCGATLDPVAAVPGHDLRVFCVDQDEVVAVAGEGLREVRAGDYE